MKKLLFPLGLIVLFLLVVGITVWINTSGGQQNAPPQPTPPLTLPSIDRSLGVAGAPTAIQWSGVAELFTQLPQELPVYKTEQTQEDEIIQIAASLGFTGSSTTNEQRIPPTTEWHENNSLLVVRDSIPTTLSFEKQSTAPFVGSLAGKEEASRLAQDLLTSLFPQSSLGVSVLSWATTNVDSTGTPTYIAGPNKATTIEATYILANYPVYMRPTTVPAISLFMSSGAVYRGSLTIPPTFQQKEMRPLANPSVAQQALIAGGGILIGLGEQKGASLESSSSPTFSAVTVTNVRMAYLYLPGESLLIPVYHFRGVATGEKGEKFSVEYLVRATE